ncbi:patatin-like phospholipase domain-containing protein, putative [Eimeria tenella]|uniref:Patatin-like phospholipase domain-containing protein, putative n=1 Tax=Eimeria tenella TaxID=5802 RepID=U6KRY0_EIMTE|nr:patatin-like phospholipase domain-containing protein, putative [Eimeria tenella]CDJ39678.1 patatin-like phospholipase domain-containing protein, putative [Eimeria tenella]|eukprot:XP_013230433.1 patatin-like phospholipase domain-containing protein, putative [Eimeria tenella]
MKRMGADLRAAGTAHRLASVLKRELRATLPEDAAEVLGQRPGDVTVTYTTVFPFLEGQFVRRFASAADLAECLVASCNIPFYVAPWPTVTCRGRQAVDGYFATKPQHFGCPPTGARRDVRVSCSSSSSSSRGGSRGERGGEV